MRPSGVPAPLPVGMFDSGIGGFTVYKELLRHSPSQPVIYFGDTYHVPYGSRSLDQIRLFALNAIEFLSGEGAAVIAVACNVSSSVLSPDDVRGSKVPVFGLIAGGAQHALNLSRMGKIGILATEATINSGSYQREIGLRNPDASVVAVPCPRFVPLVEAGERKSPAVFEACREYLAPVLSAGCDVVVHGCTHYPLLQEALDEVSGGKITFVDPGAYLALDIVEYLVGVGRNSAGNGVQAAAQPVSSRIYLSKYSEMLVKMGGEFLGMDISRMVLVNNINAQISGETEAKVG